MTKPSRLLLIALITFVFGMTPGFGQKPPKAPPYKITNIKIVPFDEASGKFEDEITPKSDRSFFNDLSISLFVTIEISGQTGSFASGRNVIINVTEGKKVKFAKTEQVGLIGSEGKYFVPVFLYSSMCSNVTITAKLSGQVSVSTMTRKVPFLCGE